jgi:hypothetical protein
MPIHDWTRVMAGIFHDFHHDWITTLKRGLNAGLLPKGYYPLAEQITGGLGPDVLTLESPGNGTPKPGSNGASSIGVALAEAPPKVRFSAVSEVDLFTLRKSRIAIRHSSDHRVVAVIEIVSPGNKARMPLFLEPERYVLAPLASSYQAAWEGVPEYWRERIDP